MAPDPSPPASLEPELLALPELVLDPPLLPPLDALAPLEPLLPLFDASTPPPPDPLLPL
jgi:hypothetical protein